MIYSSEVSGIIANQQSQMAQAANYAGYLSSRYGGGNPYASAGEGGGPPVQDPRAVDGFFAPSPGAFVYGNPIGASWDRESQLSGASTGLMRGVREAGSMAMGGLMLAGFFNPAFNVFDPFSRSLDAFGTAGAATFRRAGLATRQQGWWRGAYNAVKARKFDVLGRSLATGVAGALPIAAGYYAGYKVATFGLDNLMAGAEEQLAINSTLLNFGTRMNMPGMAGRPWSYGDMRAMEGAVYDISRQNLWTDPGDINQVLAGGMQAGMFRGVRNTSELQVALKELVGALRDTARTFNTTLSGAIPYLQGFREMGFTGFGAAANAVRMTRGFGVPAGMSPETMMGMGRMGMQYALQAGASASQIRSSIMRSMEFAGRVGHTNQIGVLSNDQVLEMTGQVEEAGRAALAQRMTDTAQSLLHSRFGRWITMAMMNPATGEYDSARAQYMGSIRGMLGGARDAMSTRSGIVRWMLHRGRIGQQAISEQGPDVFAGNVLNAIAEYTDRRTGGNPEISDLLIERLTGIGQRESHLLRSLANQAPRLREMTRQAATEELRRVQAEADYRENVNVGAVMRRIERATIERVRRPIREAGASIMLNINEGIRSAIEDIMGVHRYTISPAISNAYDLLQEGRPEQWNRLQQMITPSYMSGYSTGEREVMTQAAGALVMPGGAPDRFLADTPNYAGAGPGPAAVIGGAAAWGATLGAVRLGPAFYAAGYGAKAAQGVFEAPRLFNRLLAYPVKGGAFMPTRTGQLIHDASIAMAGRAAAAEKTFYGGLVGRLVASPLKAAGLRLSAYGARYAEAGAEALAAARGLGFGAEQAAALAAGRAAQMWSIAPRVGGWGLQVAGSAIGRGAQFLANPFVAATVLAGMAAWEGIDTYRDLQNSTLSSAATMLIRAQGAHVKRVSDYSGKDPYLRAFDIGQSPTWMSAGATVVNTLSLGIGGGADPTKWTAALRVEDVSRTLSSIRSVDLSDLTDEGLGKAIAATVADELRRTSTDSSWRGRESELGGHLRSMANNVIDRSNASESTKNVFRSKVNSGDGAVVMPAIAEKFLPDSIRDIFSKAQKPMSDSELGKAFERDLLSRFGDRMERFTGVREVVSGLRVSSVPTTREVKAVMSEDAVEFVKSHATAMAEMMDQLMISGAGEGEKVRAWRKWLEENKGETDQAVLEEVYRGLTAGYRIDDKGNTMTIQEAVRPTTVRHLSLAGAGFNRQQEATLRMAYEPWRKFQATDEKNKTSTRARMDKALGSSGLSTALGAYYETMLTKDEGSMAAKMEAVISEYMSMSSRQRGVAMRYLEQLPGVGNRLMAVELTKRTLLDGKDRPRKDAYARSFYMNARLGRYKVDTDALEASLQNTEEWESLNIAERVLRGQRVEGLTEEERRAIAAKYGSRGLKGLKEERSKLRWDYYTEQVQARIDAAVGVDEETRAADMAAARDIAAVASGQRGMTPEEVRQSVIAAGKYGAHVPTARGTVVSKDAGSGIQQFVTALANMTNSVEAASKYLAGVVAGAAGGTANGVPPAPSPNGMSYPEGL